jgi:hypothetical protein
MPSIIRAQDITLIPSISLSGEYDDNVTFSRNEENDDYAGIVSPGFRLDYASELLSFKTSALVDVLRYYDDSDLDTENWKYALNGVYRLVERWSVSGDFSYIKDETLDSELEETGIVFRRDERERLNAGGGISYVLSELSDIGAEYSYSKTDYDDKGLDDYDRSSVSLSYNRKFNNGLDVISVTPQYSRGNSDESKVDGYRLTVGWTHLPSETYRLGVSLGVRYTTTDYDDNRNDSNNWGGVADINLRKSGENYSVKVGFNSDVYYKPSTAEVIQVFKVYGDYSRRILERLSMGVRGRVSLAKSEDDDAADDDDIWYFRVDPFLRYMLTENHSLRLAYTYQQEYDKNFNDDERTDRNRVSLTLNFNFPYKW